MAFSRLVSASICLCAFAALPLHHLPGLTLVESADGECPFEEDGKRSEEERIVFPSARRRLIPGCYRDLRRPHEAGDRLHQIASYASRSPAIVGHQLANGLCAPLLI